MTTESVTTRVLAVSGLVKKINQDEFWFLLGVLVARGRELGIRPSEVSLMVLHDDTFLGRDAGSKAT